MVTTSYHITITVVTSTISDHHCYHLHHITITVVTTINSTTISMTTMVVVTTAITVCSLSLPFGYVLYM